MLNNCIKVKYYGTDMNKLFKERPFFVVSAKDVIIITHFVFYFCYIVNVISFAKVTTPFHSYLNKNDTIYIINYRQLLWIKKKNKYDNDENIFAIYIATILFYIGSKMH